MPDHTATRDAAAAAGLAFGFASREHHRADAAYRVALDHYGGLAWIEDPASALSETELLISETQGRLNKVESRTASFLVEPTMRALSPDLKDAERDLWQISRDVKARELRSWSPSDTGVESPERPRGYTVPVFSIEHPGRA